MSYESGQVDGNSGFYAVRFSQSKHNDTEPQVSDGEKIYLRSVSEGRQVVLFDEDRATGGTLDTAAKFFSKFLGKGRIEMFTNFELPN